MENQKKKTQTLYQKLDWYSRQDYYPFHMPGHKRRQMQKLSPYCYDITEIDGFDNLHHPEDLIRERLQKVTQFYDSKKSYYLVNGSTCGILAAISAVMERKKKLILARNSHKSAYHAVFLTKTDVEYLYPEYRKNLALFGGISPDYVEKILEQQKNLDEIGAVFLTSPTYEGVVSDVEKIADIVHKKGIPLIVDEAHGAHFGRNSYFPVSALDKGADVVIQSLHKTLPSLTQTAILHIGKNSLVSSEQIERYLAIYQSSSPSYVLMSSMDYCMDVIMGERGRQWFGEYVEMLEWFRKKCKNLQYFQLLDMHRDVGHDRKTDMKHNVETDVQYDVKHDVEIDVQYVEKQENFFGKCGNYQVFDYDRSKLVIVPDCRYYDGQKLYEVLLERYHLQMEMASERYVIAMTSVCDRKSGFERLYGALAELDKEIAITGLKRGLNEVTELDHKKSDVEKQGHIVERMKEDVEKQGYITKEASHDVIKKAVICKKISDAYCEKCDIIELHKAVDRISHDFVYLYPPGIPILTPGEMVTQDIVQMLERYLDMGLNVLGMSEEKGRYLRVL